MKRSVVIVLHIGYWFLYAVLLVVILFSLRVGAKPGSSAHFGMGTYIFLSVFALVPAAIGFYAFYSTLFTRFLAKKRLLFFFYAAIVSAACAGVAGASMLTLLALNNFGPGIFADGLRSALPITIIMAVIALLNGIIGLVMKGFISWYGDIKLKEELNRKNHEAELALIKSQLDPHFLFNTINNIDVLIELDGAKASLYLNKLSAIMRFMLYETKVDKIPLAKELEYIEKYIELQKIRSINPGYVNFSVKGDPACWQISPMIFIPFIENAFKHLGNRKVNDALCIYFTIESNTLLFECGNNMSAEIPANTVGGLGSALIQKRLTMLYPNQHKINVSNNGAWYTVNLTINK